MEVLEWLSLSTKQVQNTVSWISYQEHTLCVLLTFHPAPLYYIQHLFPPFQCLARGFTEHAHHIWRARQASPTDLSLLSLLHLSDSSFPLAPAAAICLATKILPAHPTASSQTSKCTPSCPHHSFHSTGQTTKYLCLPKVRPFTYKTQWFSLSPVKA